MSVDYILVGQGLAGTCMARALEKQGASFVVVNEIEESCSSRVAAGVFNPITGKRLVKTWLADDIFPFAKSFYEDMEALLGISIIRNLNIYKPYAGPSQENDIVGRSAEPSYKAYVNLDFDHTPFIDSVDSKDGGLEILKSGNICVSVLLDAYQSYLSKKDLYIDERFDFEKLKLVDGGVCYGAIEAKKIIFCEGHQAIHNPYFAWLPFSLTKGEILELKIDGFQKDYIVNRGGFLLPIDNGNYLAGASYEKVVNKELTEKGKGMVKEKIDNFLKLPYEMINHRVGIRPTVKDRRPFVGRHPELEQIEIFNGLGTKGVTIGPWFAEQFAQHLINSEEIMPEANISRYYSLYFDSVRN